MNALMLLLAILTFLLLGLLVSLLLLIAAVRIFRVPDAPLSRIFKVYLLMLLLGLATNVAQEVAEPLLLLTVPFGIALTLYILKRGFDISWKRSIGIYLVSTALTLLVLTGPAVGMRAYLVQAFKIPSGAMIPTLLVGDHLFADKYTYRSRMPERGEIAIFKFPRDRETDFIKRVVALPGESIALEGGELLIDGEKVDDSHARYEPTSTGGADRSFAPFRVPAKGDTIRLDSERRELYGFLVANELGFSDRAEVDQFVGELVDRGHLVVEGKEIDTWTVGSDYIFVMGDNRDNSYDSRFWGPVSVEDVFGRALILYWSYGKGPLDIRWDRIGKVLVDSKD